MNRHIQLMMTIAIFLVAIDTSSQTQLYSGELSAGGFTGKAEYPFYMEQGDSILDGQFLMYKSNVNALLKEKDSFFSFSGKFEKGRPMGFWKFQFGEFGANESSQVVGYQYRVNVSGIQHDALGNLSSGKPDGEWTYKISKIENSEVSDVLFNSKIFYDKGIPQKSFQIENDSITLVGRFLRNGLAHDIWVVYSDLDSEPSESWYFDNGRLRKIEKNTPDGQISIQVFDGSAKRTKSIVLDGRYLQLVEWHLRKKQTQLNTTNLGMYRLLFQNAAQYESIDSFFNDLGKSEFMPSFRTSVPYYPLDSLEVSQLETTIAAYKASTAICDELIESPQFGLLTHSNPEVQYYYKVVEQIKTSFLIPIGALAELDHKDIVEFLPREMVFENIWPNGLPEKRIQLSESDDQFSVWELDSNFDYELNGFEGKDVAQMTLYAQKSLEHISSKMDVWLRQERKQRQFMELDKELVKATKTLEKNIDSLSSLYNGEISKALIGISETKESLLKEYSDMQESEAKLQFGKSTLDCLVNLNELVSRIGQLPENERAIMEKYQDAVWNPFTATIMDEDVKKRITSVYNNILIPHILKTAQKPLLCKEVVETTQLLDNLQTRILELRDEPTKKLERKLRKEQDPKAILELLGVESNLKKGEQ